MDVSVAQRQEVLTLPWSWVAFEKVLREEYNLFIDGTWVVDTGGWVGEV